MNNVNEKEIRLDERDAFRHNVLTSGHRACPGCGEIMAARMVTDIIGPQAIYVTATGCLQVVSSHYQQSSWQAPWIHSLYANAASVAAGIEAALRIRGDQTPVIVQAGDGATFDAGLQALSGMVERGHDILFICYDNEANMNTGAQRSGSTPYGVHSKTSPIGQLMSGKQHIKKDVLAIMAAHRIPYAATASVAFVPDLKAKVEKALTIKGPRYLQILSPCPPGWGHASSHTIKIARLAVQTALFPLIEMEYGETTNVMRLSRQHPVEEYLDLQTRYKHIKSAIIGGQQTDEVRHLQALADACVQRYHLLEADTEWDTQRACHVQRNGRFEYRKTDSGVKYE